jgi:hypothetical protein
LAPTQYEPGLDTLVEKNVRAGRLYFTTELAAVARAADLMFRAVGTPIRRGDGYADLSYVYQAVEEIAPHLSGFKVITTKIDGAGRQPRPGPRHPDRRIEGPQDAPSFVPRRYRERVSMDAPSWRL